MRLFFRHYKRIFIILLAPLSMLLLYLSSMIPEVVENVYSKGLYPLIAKLFSYLTGFVGFSLAEMFLIILPFVLLFVLVKTVVRIIKGKGQRKKLVSSLAVKLLMSVSIIYSLFVFLWGFNYSREPVSKLAGLEVRPATVEELAGASKGLITEANRLRSEIHEDSTGIMRLADGKYNSLLRAQKGFDEAGKIFPFLAGKYSKAKGVIMSEAMSYTGISGVFFPFTGEPNVNMSMPDCVIPSTASHEMAHSHGFNREDEANYVAYLVCRFHPDIDYQYSGVLMGLINCMNSLYDTDRETFSILRKTYSEGINRDLDELRNFWKRYEGPVERASNSINNAYLKANMQKDGVKSYDRMVDLIIAEHRKETKK